MVKIFIIFLIVILVFAAAIGLACLYIYFDIVIISVRSKLRDHVYG